MKHYLLFDSGCSICNDIASNVETLSDELIKLRSLRDKEVQSWLTKADPEWKWEPTLLTKQVGTDEVTIFTGIKMKYELLKILGPIRALKVFQLVSDIRASYRSNSGRRQLLGTLGGFIMGAVLFGRETKGLQAQESSQNSTYLPLINTSLPKNKAIQAQLQTINTSEHFQSIKNRTLTDELVLCG